MCLSPLAFAVPQSVPGVSGDELSASARARGTQAALAAEVSTRVATPVMLSDRVTIAPGRSYRGRLVVISPDKLVVRDEKTKKDHEIVRGKQDLEGWRVGEDVIVRLDDSESVVGVDRIQSSQ